MNKIQKIFKASALLLQKPYLINKIIDDNDVWRKKLEKEFSKDALQEIKLQDLMDGSAVTVKPFSFMEGGSLPTDLALLRLLAMKFDQCKYFEIGTWRGESVANVAEVAAECVTMNLSADEMNSLGMSMEYTDQHAMFSKGLVNVNHLEGNSLNFDFNGLNRKFDLIFIDGDHHYESIRKDTENVFRHLVHEHSIVVWHDYAWQPSNIRFETMAAILNGVPAHHHQNIYAVRNTLCAVFLPGAIESYDASPIARKDEAYTLVLKP